MTKSLSIKFEEAVRFLVERFPPSDENSRKPILFHDIRVGTHLYEKGYSEEIVLAGLLHDAIEWSDMNEEEMRILFGDRIIKLVLVNTKNKNI